MNGLLNIFTRQFLKERKTVGKRSSLRSAYTVSLLSVCFCTYSQAPTEPDSLVHELKEIVVEAPVSTQLGNKITYRPPKSLMDISNSSIQLLAGLQIPELVIDPTVGTIEMFGNGTLAIRINGRIATDKDVASLNPKNIVRVDYISNPGVRYRNADGVLDIITHQTKESCSSMFANIIQSANRGWGNYTGALRYNTGKSEWSIDYHSNPMWNMDCYRDNKESITLADGTHINRIESGIKIPNRMVTHRLSVQYSYASGRDFLLNIQPRLFHTNDRYRSEGVIAKNNITQKAIEVVSDTIDVTVDLGKLGAKKVNINAYQDLDGNCKLDFDGYGRPTEPCLQTEVEVTDSTTVICLERKQY